MGKNSFGILQGILSKICHCPNERRRREDQGPEAVEGVESGEGCPHSQPTMGSGECRKLPQRGPGQDFVAPQVASD